MKQRLLHTKIIFNELTKAYFSELINILYYKHYFSIEENAREYVHSLVREVERTLYIKRKYKAPISFLREGTEPKFYTPYIQKIKIPINYWHRIVHKQKAQLRHDWHLGVSKVKKHNYKHKRLIFCLSYRLQFIVISSYRFSGLGLSIILCK